MAELHGKNKWGFQAGEQKFFQKKFPSEWLMET